jgi:glutathione S-transferase
LAKSRSGAGREGRYSQALPPTWGTIVLTVHHLNHSRSQRVLWLLEELDLPYEIKFYERDPATRLAPPALRAVHPLGKSPVLVDGTLTIPETGTIVEYLVEKSGGRLRPPAGTPERLRWTYWLHFAEGSLMPPLVLDLVLASTPGRAPETLRDAAKAVADGARQGYVAPNLKTQFDFVEAELSKGPWFAGEEFSAADVMMSFPLEAAVSRARAAEGRPKLAAFVERIHARPAYRKALARGGPYAYAQ